MKWSGAHAFENWPSRGGERDGVCWNCPPGESDEVPARCAVDKAHGDRDYGVKAVEVLPGRYPSGSRILPAGLSTGGGFTCWRGFTSLVSRFKVNTATLRCEEEWEPLLSLAATSTPIVYAAEENAKSTIETLFNETMLNRRT